NLFAIMRFRGGIGFLFRLLDKNLAIRPEPGGNAMPPPELARDAPGLDVAHPFIIGVGPFLGHEFRLARLHRTNGRLSQRRGISEPLVREQRLDNNARAIAVRDRMRMRLDFFEKAERLYLGDDFFPRLEPLKAAI